MQRQTLSSVSDILKMQHLNALWHILFWTWPRCYRIACLFEKEKQDKWKVLTLLSVVAVALSNLTSVKNHCFHRWQQEFVSLIMDIMTSFRQNTKFGKMYKNYNASKYSRILVLRHLNCFFTETQITVGMSDWPETAGRMAVLSPF